MLSWRRPAVLTILAVAWRTLSARRPDRGQSCGRKRFHARDYMGPSDAGPHRQDAHRGDDRREDPRSPAPAPAGPRWRRVERWVGQRVGVVARGAVNRIPHYRSGYD